MIAHGGRLDEAVARFGGTRGAWLDLSTGIGPTSYPIPELAKGAWRDLPDANAYRDACEAIRGAVDAPADAGISLGPGSQAHIQALPRIVRQQDVAIVGFTYMEHALAWQQAGHRVFASDGLASAEATARVIVLVNPNNPDGRIHDPKELRALARRLGQKGGLLVVDEAFGETAPNASVAPDTGRDGLVVLRSLGKFYGLAGLRLGAMIGSPGLAALMNDLLGPWAVSGPALAIGQAAWADRTWRTRMQRKLKLAREEMETLLQEAGLTIEGGTDLFVLASHPKAGAIWQLLAERHILVRSFARKPDWLRFGLPSGKVAQRRLARALQDAALVV